MSARVIDKMVLAVRTQTLIESHVNLECSLAERTSANFRFFEMQSTTDTIPISTFFTIDTNDKFRLSRTNGVGRRRLGMANYIPELRPNASESPRIESATCSLSQLRSHRQVQLPLAIPGVFILADAESPSISCTGAIAMQATELQMARIIPK